MDYYKILKLSDKATEKEIEENFKVLCATYDPAFNTSPIAHKRYREVILAYQMLQNKKVLTLQEDNPNFVKEEYDLYDYNKHNLEQEKGYQDQPLKDVKEYEKVLTTKDIILDNYKYKKEIEVDYLEVILGSQKEVEVYQKNICPNSKNITCDLCNGIGKVSYNQEIIVCPKCGGIKYINKCDCHHQGHLKKTSKELVNLQSIDLNKPLLIKDTYLTFKVLNKEKVKISKNEVFVEYDLSKDEVLHGFNKTFVTKEGPIEINTKEYEKDYIFSYEGKQIIIHFNRIPFDGNNIYKTILFDKKDINKNLYLNLETLTYSLEKNSNHLYKIVFHNDYGTINIKGEGEKGYLEGIDGDLILTYYGCSGYKPIGDNKKINIVNTTLLHNVCNLGFKGQYYLVETKECINLYTGKDKTKNYLSNYLLLRILVYFIWICIPLLLFVLPINKELFTSLCIITISYSLLANIILRIKI